MEREIDEEFSSEVDPEAKRQKRYVRNRRLAGIGWMLIILGLILALSVGITLPRTPSPGIPILTPTSTPIPSGTVNESAPGPIAEASISTLVIALYAPTDLQVGQPVDFTVKVVNNVGP
jgi:hypothetical protein